MKESKMPDVTKPDNLVEGYADCEYLLQSLESNTNLMRSILGRYMQYYLEGRMHDFKTVVNNLKVISDSVNDDCKDLSALCTELFKRAMQELPDNEPDIGEMEDEFKA